MPLSRARWLLDAILRFSAVWRDVDIVVVEGSHAELAGPLRDSEIDLMLGALRNPAAVEDLVQEQVFIDRPQVIARAGHPLAATGRPTGAALAAHDWILPTRDTPLRR